MTTNKFIVITAMPFEQRAPKYVSSYLIEISDTCLAFGAKQLSFMRKEQAQNTQPYSNMKARRVVLVLGFVMTIISFAVAIYASLALFFPSLCVPKDVLPFKSISTLYVVSMSLSFLGIVFAVAGANTQKAIARLSFFFGTVAFIGSAGFLVVLLLVNFFPFQALGNLLS